MHLKTRHISLLLISIFGLAVVLSVSGCKKSDDTAAVGAGTVAEPPPPAAAPLPGGAEVLGALQQKDYSGAVRQLSGIKARLTPDQRAQYAELLQQTKEVLINEMGRSPAAADAYRALRFMETGR